MKKLMVLLAVALMLSLAGPVMAEGLTDLLDKLPNVKQGVCWDVKEDVLLTSTTADILEWKYEDTTKASLGIGLVTDFDDYTYPIGEVCYKLGGLEKLGFNYPLAELVKFDLKLWGGREFNTPEKDWHYGLGVGIFDAKF